MTDKSDIKEMGESIDVIQNKDLDSDIKEKNESIDNDQNFTKKNIEKLGKKIQLVDSDETKNLLMFCYTNCSDEDSDLVKQCRGVVFHGDKLVMKSFPYTEEYTNRDFNILKEKLKYMQDWKFFESHEGTLIRMFYFKNEWFISTHKKLNAFRSKWASKVSFGSSFVKALEFYSERNEKFNKELGDSKEKDVLQKFYDTLDKNLQYMFLLRNTNENRIVCKAPKDPCIFHVGTFNGEKLDMNIRCLIPFANEIKFDNVEDIIKYIENKISYNDLQGIICFNKDNFQMKILHEDYHDLFSARGNEASIKFRYIQVRNSRRGVNMLYHLYPEYGKVFEEYENILYYIAKNIHRAYVQRFIKKRYVTVPKEEFSIIRMCHDWHLSDRSNNRISLNKVIEAMNTQTPTVLNHMIKRFKLEQNKQKEYQISSRPRTNSSISTKSFEKSPDVKKININTLQMSPLVLGGR